MTPNQQYQSTEERDRSTDRPQNTYKSRPCPLLCTFNVVRSMPPGNADPDYCQILSTDRILAARISLFDGQRWRRVYVTLTVDLQRQILCQRLTLAENLALQIYRERDVHTSLALSVK